MSKLIFPDHGGVLVPDDTKVVKTVAKTVGNRKYIIKVVRYQPKVHAMYINSGRPFGYHYLTPDGGVVSSNSGNSRDIEGAIEHALKSIRSWLADARRERAEAKKTPSQKKQDRLLKAAKFFQKHSGSDLDHGLKLAKAERFAEDSGWKVEWSPDQDPYEMGDAETEHPNEVLVAVLKDASGNVLESLSGIGDPNQTYARVVEAELALEAMPR
jgi:hypothetical protein